MRHLYREISFCTRAMEICRLWAQARFDTFHQLIIVEELWSQPDVQVNKQGVVARREIKPVASNDPHLTCPSSARVRAAYADVHCPGLVRCDWEIYRHLCGIALIKSKPEIFSVFCAHPWVFSSPSCAKLVIAKPNCDNLVENRAWTLWKFT
jgi:hypothetical protein